MKILQLTFKSVIEPQRGLIHAWLKQDYIHEWIHGQGLKNTLTSLDIFLAYQAEHHQLPSLDSESTHHWIGYNGDKPFVYLLTTYIDKESQDIYARHRSLDNDAITLDIFITDPEYLGKGYAVQIINDFLHHQFLHVTEVFIDPEQRNTRAIHAYQKIGFQIIDEFIASWHPVPHYLMKLSIKQTR